MHDKMCRLPEFVDWCFTGTPCIDHSYAGKQLGIEGPTSHCAQCWMKFHWTKRTPIVIHENVPPCPAVDLINFGLPDLDLWPHLGSKWEILGSMLNSGSKMEVLKPSCDDMRRVQAILIQSGAALGPAFGSDLGPPETSKIELLRWRRAHFLCFFNFYIAASL
eukprot:11098146-Karenia_brevis.AAC.1